MYKYLFLQEIISTENQISWRIFGPYRYDGWLYGKVDLKSKQFFGNDTAYIYQDMTTAILGIFVNNTLIEGREAKIEYYR
jgi:hypothetical protein